MCFQNVWHWKSGIFEDIVDFLEVAIGNIYENILLNDML